MSHIYKAGNGITIGMFLGHTTIKCPECGNHQPLIRVIEDQNGGDEYNPFKGYNSGEFECSCGNKLEVNWK